jgi:cephalosporin-C deacetylase-like acetyl esterase
LNRREFGVTAGAILSSPTARLLSSTGGLPPQPQPTDAYSEEMPDMLVSYMAGKLNTLATRWDQKRAHLNSATDISARNAFVRARFIEMLHGLPERSPLNPITVKAMDRDGYRVENVMFESRPDFWVTGNLYVPTRGDGPFPGIISPCGHYPLARMIPQYQSVYLNLVKSGFVVLGYDPIGQGERRQYWNPETNVVEVGGAVYEHSMPGQLLLLLGENLTQYRVWDGVRAIDYLLTRSEVDPKRIGCAGHSGGGTLTKFIGVVDERVQCAAIIEGGTANRWPLNIAPWEPIGPADAEQNLFPAALYGIDNVDLHTAIAPRPLLVAIEHYSRGFDRAAEAIQTRYRQLGVPEKFLTVAADDPHAWTVKLRLATTDWFCRWFYHRNGPLSEPEFKTEPPEALYCTPDGSIRYSQKGKTIFSILLNQQSNLPPVPSVPKTSAERESFVRETCDKLRVLLRYQKSGVALKVRQIVSTPRKGYKIEKVEFLSEPGIYIPAWIYIPDNNTGTLRAILYVSDEGIEAEGMEFEGEEESGLTSGVLDTLVRSGTLVVAVDVRGIGETRPPHSSESSAGNDFRQLFDVETALAYMAWFMDQSLLGMRVQDVMRSVDYVMSRDDVDKANLHVIGKGRGGLWCLYAAALDLRIRSLICVRSLLCYKSLAQVDRYLYGADVFIPGVLRQLDLPQVAAAMGCRPLALVLPVDAMKKVVDADTAQEAYHWTQAVYQAAGLPNLFRIESGGTEIDSPANYLGLIHESEGLKTVDGRQGKDKVTGNHGRSVP